MLSSLKDSYLQHTISYPISSEVINMLFFVTSPDSFDTALQGPSVIPSSKEEVLSHYHDWEEDVLQAIDVCPSARIMLLVSNVINEQNNTL